MNFTKITNKTAMLLRLTLCLAMLGISAATVQAQQYENPEGSISQGAAGCQNVTVDLFRGRASISIPLYNYKTRSLSIPISLDYTPVDTKSNYSIYNDNIPASDGHVYHPGWVGLGWTLSAGGCINRAVKGIPDETESSGIGSLVGNFFNFNTNYDPTGLVIGSCYDVDEDEFSFNFAGYSGTFFFYRGEWKVFSQQTFKIQIFQTNGKIYGFLMETPDGITYTFGNYDNPGLNSNYENAIEFADLSKVATTWYLTRIESPEGDQIDFNYGYDVDDEIFHSFTPIQKQSNIYSIMKTLNPTTNQWTPITSSSFQKKYPTDEEVANGSVTYNNNVVYLKSITSNSSSIEVAFDKLVFDEMFYPEYKSAKSYKLDKIRIKNTAESNAFKEYKLNYSGGVYATGNPTEILKLTSLQESGRATTSQSLVSQLPFEMSYFADSHEISPNVLSQIKYPTGGSVDFEFEGHYYQGPGFAKGFRIKRKVVKSSDSDDAMISDYFYIPNSIFPDDISGNDFYLLSSGLLSRNETHFQESVTPVFLQGENLFQFYMSKNTQYDCAFPSDQMVPNSTVPALLVGYSDVWEMRSSENSEQTVTKLGFSCSSFVNYYTRNPLNNTITYNNIDIAGTLIRSTSYNANKIMTSDAQLEYEDANALQFPLQRYVGKVFTYYDEHDHIERSSISFVGYNTRHTLYRLKSKNMNTSSYNTETNYSYVPSTNLIAEETVIDLNFDNPTIINGLESSEGGKSSTTSTSYKYNSTFPNWWESNVFDPLIYHHQLDLPVETVTKKDGKIIAAELIKYETIDIPNNEPRGRAIKFIKPSQVYTLQLTEPIEPTTYNSVASDWSTMDSRFKLQTTFNYDYKGNLLQYQNEGSAPVAFDYDNQNRLPLVKIKGLLHSTYILYKNNQSLDASIPADVNKIRVQFPSAQITSYTFDPKFGVTSVTTPNGISTTKEYDAFGRVKVLKDRNLKIQKTMEYNYGL